MAKAAEELNFKFYFTLINSNLNLNSYMWLAATILGSIDLESQCQSSTLLTSAHGTHYIHSTGELDFGHVSAQGHVPYAGFCESRA